MIGDMTRRRVLLQLTGMAFGPGVEYIFHKQDSTGNPLYSIGANFSGGDTGRLGMALEPGETIRVTDGNPAFGPSQVSYIAHAVYID